MAEIPGSRAIRVAVPPHGRKSQAWETAYGPRADRLFKRFEAYEPPHIKDLQLTIPPDVAARCEEAMEAAVRLDAEYGSRLKPLSGMLLRTEAIATSKIENEEASTEDYIRAMYGNRSNQSAMAMVRASDAIDHMVQAGATEASLLEGHRTLMRGSSPLLHSPGRYRTVQNWIGGSDYSPRDALHIPPPPDQVPELMADLFRFAAREDLPALPQAAILHAQFENIHPFTDGNGRTGRALISALLHQRGYTRHTTIPIAAALAAVRDDYFETLWAYRDHGDAGPVIALIATATAVTSDEARATAQRLEEMPSEWSELAGHPRRGSTVAALLSTLTERPILSAQEAEELSGASERSAARALSQLEDAGIIHEITGRKRNRVWLAGDITAELDDLAHRISQEILAQGQKRTNEPLRRISALPPTEDGETGAEAARAERDAR